MASITKRPKGRYQVKIRRKGFPPVIKTFARKRDAVAFVNATEAAMDRGQYGDLSFAQRTTVGEALEKYCKEYISVHRKGDQQAYLVRRLAAKASFAAFALTNLREHHLQAFIKERRKSVSEKTVREDILAISDLYKYAVAHWEGCAGLKNPAKDIPFRHSDNKRERRLKSAAASGRSDGLSEEQALLMACEKSRAPWLRDAIELLIETAMRRGELAALQCVDRHKPLTSIGAALTPISLIKGGREQDVTKNDPLPRGVNFERRSTSWAVNHRAKLTLCREGDP